MIFPGMDPYLEDPAIWPSVHSALIVYLAEQLVPLIRPRYIASIEQRVFVEGPDHEIIPDVWLRQSRPPAAIALAVGAEEDDGSVLVSVPELEVHETYVAILDRTADERL